MELEGKLMTLFHRVWAPADCFSVYSGHLLWVRNGKTDDPEVKLFLV